jgi:NAD(P)-dependent dehydrogenase (short-subunit alcohol dehydrogenase family)
MATPEATRELDGQVAIVTGAARGIGLAIARRLARGGAAVCVTDLDADAVRTACRELQAEGASVLAVVGSVADPEHCRSAAAAAAERLGDLRILVNNAGLTDDVMLHQMTDAQWNLVHDVNLRGAFNMLRAVAPWFRDRERRLPRRVVNIGSAAGIYGTVGNANYSAAKAGVLALTRSAAREWAAFGVTVNAVAPGYVQTRLTAPRSDPKDRLGFPPAAVEGILAKIPVGRAGTPEDIAHAVAFLCSPHSGYITGETLEVNGGLGDLQIAV